MLTSLTSVPSLFAARVGPGPRAVSGQRGIADLGRQALFLAVLLLAAACQPSKVQKAEPAPQLSPPPAPVIPLPEEILPLEPVGPEPIAPSPRVALLVPLSGAHANVGEGLLNAAQLALFDIATDEFELYVYDTAGTPLGAQEALAAAFEAGSSLIIGPLFATSVQAIADQALERQVSIVSFSNDVSAARPGVFVMGLPPEMQVLRVVDFASTTGLSRFAALAPNTAYGNAVVRALQEATRRNGVELARVVTYDPANQDLSPEVRSLAQYDERHQALLRQRQQLESLDDEASKLALKRLENLDTIGNPDFDAVLLPVGGRSLLTIAPLLAFYDVDPSQVRFLGTALWDVPGLGTEPTLQGGWFPAPAPEPWQAFKDRYRGTYGVEPPRIASLAYDATALAAFMSRIAAQSGQVPDYSVAALTNPNGFSGTDGIFRFLPNGSIDRGLSVLQMERGSVEVIDPAPATFETLYQEFPPEEGFDTGTLTEEGLADEPLPEVPLIEGDPPVEGLTDSDSQ